MSPCLGFPTEHQRLWQEAKLTAKLAISAYWLCGDRMRDVLVIVAEPKTLVARIVSRFCPSAIVDEDDHMIVAVLSGGTADDFSQNLKGVPEYRGALPIDSFGLLVVDGNDHRIISKCDVRRRLAQKRPPEVPVAGVAVR